MSPTERPSARRRMAALGAALCVLPLVLPASAGAVSVYVDDDTGDDANGNACYSPATPCATIQHALSGLPSPLDPGGIVVVDGGSYDEQVTMPYGLGLTGEEFTGDVEPATVLDGGGGTGITTHPGGNLAIGGLTVTGSAVGIEIAGTVTVSRSRLVGDTIGVRVADASGPVLLADDLVTGSGQGLVATDSPGGPEAGDVTVEGSTFAANAADVALLDTALTLDSTILEDPVGLGASTSASCEISFSRGPAAGSEQSGCDAFSTTAPPGFADPGLGDYSLAPGSAMVDAGNPAPAPGALDLAGSPRALDGDGECPLEPVRDIGAYELSPAQPDCVAPQTTARKPRLSAAKRRATFGFSSTEPGSRFECRLDGRAFTGCASPRTYRGLAYGRHRFAVRAVDAAGNRDSSAAVRRFALKRPARR